MKQHECKRGTKLNKYGLFGDQIIARGGVRNFYDVLALCYVIVECRETLAPPLSAANNALVTLCLCFFWNISIS